MEALAALSDVRGTDVILIGSTSTPEDRALRDRLEARGVRVIREFVNVEEYYKLADCYIFPVNDSDGSVEMPLSVLEALASGVPVLTTSFGGLRDFFMEGDDLRYWDTPEALVAAADSIRTDPPQRVRDMGEFSWQRIAERVLETLDRRRQK